MQDKWDMLFVWAKVGTAWFCAWLTKFDLDAARTLLPLVATLFAIGASSFAMLASWSIFQKNRLEMKRKDKDDN